MSDETIIEATETHTVKVVPVTHYEVQHSSTSHGVGAWSFAPARKLGTFENRADAETVAKLLAKSFEK